MDKSKTVTGNFQMEEIEGEIAKMPLIDQHCHNIVKGYVPLRRMFAETSNESILEEHVSTKLSFKRSIRELASLFQCEPTERAVEQYRKVHNTSSLCFSKIHNMQAMLIDDGYDMNSNNQSLEVFSIPILVNCSAFHRSSSTISSMLPKSSVSYALKQLQRRCFKVQ